MTRCILLLLTVNIAAFAQTAPRNLNFADGQPGYTVPPSAAYGNLTETIKLWAYIKYFHTRVTLSDIDWDKALLDVMPAILQAHNDHDFAAALTRLLAPLHDPYTRVINPADEQPGNRSVLSLQPTPTDVMVVTLQTGTGQQAQAANVSLKKQLQSAKALVIDLRGSDRGYPNVRIFPLAVDGASPAILRRYHFGYRPQTPETNLYHSSWQTEDGDRVYRSTAIGVRPVFLVNSQTAIPPSALELQDAGGCAIISEDPISDAQTYMGRDLPVGHLRVRVRTLEFEHADGTSGLTANVVLNQAGDAALQDAIEFARSGNWPKPIERTRFLKPPAVFTEKSYPTPYPDTQLRLLAAARIWGVFNYFHPYKYLYGENWDAVLAEFLPKMAAAKNAREYHLAVAEMVAHTHDTHCWVYSHELAKARGTARPPLEVRWIENQPVVTRVIDTELAARVHPGDMVTKIDGDPVRKRIDELSPTIAASTPQSLMGRVMIMLLSATPGAEPTVTFRGADNSEHDVSLRSLKTHAEALYPLRSGEIYRLLNPKLGYVDLDRLTIPQVDAMFDALRNTDAIIMDLRGYPHDTVYSIAPRLADTPGRVSSQFRTNIVSTAGMLEVRSEMGEQTVPLTGKPHYQGKTVALIDDRAISHSEASGMMLRAANGTVFIGSPTTGANGNTTGFLAPGDIRIPFTGMDVRWPDGRQLQRVGITPDIEAHPTVEGMRAGRDEILERAVTYLETGH